MGTLLSDLTRTDQLRFACEHDVSVRSGMTGAELVEALGRLGVAIRADHETGVFRTVDRFYR